MIDINLTTAADYIIQQTTDTEISFKQLLSLLLSWEATQPASPEIVSDIEMAFEEKQEKLYQLIESSILPYKETLDHSHIADFLTTVLKELSLRDESDTSVDSINILAASVFELVKECNLDDKEEVYFGIVEALKSSLKENPNIKIVKNTEEAIAPDKVEIPAIKADELAPNELTRMENQIQSSINSFEAVKVKQQEIGEDVSSTNNVINTLKETLGELSKKSGVSKSQVSKRVTDLGADNRENGLKEIFYFYTRTQMMLGKKPTFDDIINELNTMNLVEFMKFAKDFQIPLSVIKLRDLYKKNAHLSREMRIEHFIKFMPKIAKAINEEKIGEIKKKIAEDTKNLNSIIKEVEKTRREANKKKEELKTELVEEEKKEPETVNEEDKKEELPKVEDENKEVIKSEEPKKEEVKDEIAPIEDTTPIKKMEEEAASVKKSRDDKTDEVCKLEALSDAKLDDEFQNFIGSDDPEKFRKKMSGISLPFGTKDKNFRIPWDDNARKYKFKSNKTADEIKEGVKKLKEKRMEVQKLKDQEKEEKYKKNREVMKSIYEKIKKDQLGPTSAASSVPEKKKYAEKNRNMVATNERVAIKPIPTKVTLKDIEKMSSKDFGIENVSDEEINDEDDIEVLRRFNVISEKNTRAIKPVKEPIERKEKNISKASKLSKEDVQYAPEMVYPSMKTEAAKGSKMKNSMLQRAKEIERSNKEKDMKVLV